MRLDVSVSNAEAETESVVVETREKVHTTLNSSYRGKLLALQ